MIRVALSVHRTAHDAIPAPVMPVPQSPIAPFSALTIEIDRAEAFTANSLAEGHTGMIPSSLLVIVQQRQHSKVIPFTLPDFTDPPSFGVAMLQERLAEVGVVIGHRRNVQPVCVLSMMEVFGMTLASWTAELQERSAQLAEPELPTAVVFTASNGAGHQVRRMRELNNCPSPALACRQLGRQSEIQSFNEPSEMDAFWSAFQATRRQSSGQGFGQFSMA